MRYAALVPALFTVVLTGCVSNPPQHKPAEAAPTIVQPKTAAKPSTPAPGRPFERIAADLLPALMRNHNGSQTVAIRPFHPGEGGLSRRLTRQLNRELESALHRLTDQPLKFVARDTLEQLFLWEEGRDYSGVESINQLQQQLQADRLLIGHIESHNDNRIELRYALYDTHSSHRIAVSRSHHTIQQITPEDRLQATLQQFQQQLRSHYREHLRCNDKPPLIDQRIGEANRFTRRLGEQLLLTIDQATRHHHASTQPCMLSGKVVESGGQFKLSLQIEQSGQQTPFQLTLDGGAFTPEQLQRDRLPSSGFNAEDLARSGEAIRQQQAEWTTHLRQMGSHYQQAEQLEQESPDLVLKIAIWNRFLQTPDHQRNNPYSEEDERLRQQARQRLAQLQQQERKETFAPIDPETGQRFVRFPGNGEIAPFQLAVRSVTVGEYLAFAQATARPYSAHLKQRDREAPVNWVSWEDAFAYTRWLSRKEGIRDYRLPTQREWHYALQSPIQKSLQNINDGVGEWSCSPYPSQQRYLPSQCQVGSIHYRVLDMGFQVKPSTLQRKRRSGRVSFRLLIDGNSAHYRN